MTKREIYPKYDLSENPPLFVKNRCYVDNFTLRIYSDGERDNRHPLLKNLKFSLKTRSNSPIESIQLINFKGKIASNHPIRINEGNLDLTHTDEFDNSIEIKLKFETVDDLDKAYKAKTFISEIEDILDNYSNLKGISIKQKKIDYFLRPHIQGAKNSLLLSNSPTNISYDLEEKYIRLLNFSDLKLKNLASNHQPQNDEEIKIKAKIDKESIILYWDEEVESWFLQENERNKIPKNGILTILPNKAPYKDHFNRKLSLSLNCLNKLKNDPGARGSEVLRSIFLQKKRIRSTKEEDIDVDKLSEELSLGDLYKRLGKGQKIVVKDFFKSVSIVINGVAGTGKTEIGAFISILNALMGKKILISSEKNNAIDNLLKRIHQLKKDNHSINIVRFKSKSHEINDKNLTQYEIKKQIDSISKQITKECSKNKRYRDLATNFQEIFTNTDTLSHLVSLTYDIIISTYGMITEKQCLRNSLQNYDLNLIEASSSVNLNLASLGLSSSKKWLFLNDEDQITPLSPDMFLLGQPLIFPKANELQNAQKYDPKTKRISKAKINWGNKEYNRSVASIFNEISEGENLKKSTLKNQYRIHPNLYRVICHAFNKEYIDPAKKNDPKISPNKHISLFNRKDRLKYIQMDKDEILSHMGIRIANIVDKILSEKESDTLIEIGVACTDVESLKKIIYSYGMEKHQTKPLLKKNTYSEAIDRINIVFSSIHNHQEREYDIFILGVVNIRSKNFKKRIYTALTRASKFCFVFGPKIKPIYKISNYLDKNKKILEKLQEGGN